MPNRLVRGDEKMEIDFWCTAVVIVIGAVCYVAGYWIGKSTGFIDGLKHRKR